MTEVRILDMTWSGKAVGDLAHGVARTDFGEFRVEWFLDEDDKVKIILSSFGERDERVPMVIDGQAIYFKAIYDNGQWRSAWNLIKREFREETEWIKGDNKAAIVTLSDQRAKQASRMLGEAAVAIIASREGKAAEAVGRINILNGKEGNVKGVLDLLKNPMQAGAISAGSLGTFGRYRGPEIKEGDKERLNSEVAEIFLDKEVLSMVLKHPDAGVRRRAIMVVGEVIRPAGRRI